ncbi:membrane protein [Anopheles sinensis]|uniref:Membrane protein n=1 Tax=Anopheles sinensis TaxID=74873 RepID=A0A084WMS8_ANOSI|nr:membrane protein [Anopheles sinensis]
MAISFRFLFRPFSVANDLMPPGRSWADRVSTRPPSSTETGPSSGHLWRAPWSALPEKVKIKFDAVIAKPQHIE